MVSASWVQVAFGEFWWVFILASITRWHLCMCMHDPLLTTEIHCFHCASAHVKQLEWQIDHLEGELYTIGMWRVASIWRLSVANAKAQIKEKQDKEANVHLVIPWEHMKDTLYVDNLDDGFWTCLFTPKRGWCYSLTWKWRLLTLRALVRMYD